MKHLIIIIIIALSTPLQARTVTFEVQRVYDGDTIKGLIKGLPNPLNHVSIRIRNIDTPEKGHRAKCEKEKQLAQKATDFLKTLVKPGDKIPIHDNLAKWDKYGGRILYDLYVRYEGKLVWLSHLMTSKGYARPYDGGKKVGWCR